jgi:hypothetical protein
MKARSQKPGRLKSIYSEDWEDFPVMELFPKKGWIQLQRLSLSNKRGTGKKADILAGSKTNDVHYIH